jgi:hypothetical protein
MKLRIDIDKPGGDGSHAFRARAIGPAALEDLPAREFPDERALLAFLGDFGKCEARIRSGAVGAILYLPKQLKHLSPYLKLNYPVRIEVVTTNEASVREWWLAEWHKTSFSIRKGLWQRAKLRAFEDELELQDLIAKALEAYLAKSTKGAADGK